MQGMIGPVTPATLTSESSSADWERETRTPLSSHPDPTVSHPVTFLTNTILYLPLIQGGVDG